jgi:hypothetical protein
MSKGKTGHPEIDARNAFNGADGLVFFIEPPELLGIDRKRAFDKALTKAAFGVGVKALIKNLLDIRTAFNKQEMAEVGHLITTQIATASNIHERSEATLEICALFMNEESEDRTKVPTDAQVEEKITNWNNAGIPYSFFVHCAGTFNDTLRALYKAASPSSPARAKSKP